MNALKDLLEIGPAAPQRLPAGRTIATASQIASEAGNSALEVVHRKVCARSLIQQGNNSYHLGRNMSAGRFLCKKGEAAYA
jgi:hypothetical protein